MSAQVHTMDVYAPEAEVRPRIIGAVEMLIDSATAALAEHREHVRVQQEQEQFARDAEAARREAYAWMRDDPRMGADLLAAVDRQEAMFLSDGAIAR